MEKLPLSLVVVAFNEEDNIKRCIESVPFAGEVLIVDSFSQDKTVEVARAAGAKVVQEKWRGYGPQKKFATDLAAHDWVLSLDADEALSSESAEELKNKFKNLDSKTGYEFPRKSFHLKRWIMHGGWYPDAQLRLFNKKFANWNDSSVHERVGVEKVERLEKPILHWVFENISDQVITNDKYSTLQAEQLHKKGESFSLFKLVIKPWTKFIECYFLKRGFLDGLPGFIIAISASYSVFLRYAKLWEK